MGLFLLFIFKNLLTILVAPWVFFSACNQDRGPSRGQDLNFTSSEEELKYKLFFVLLLKKKNFTYIFPLSISFLSQCFFLVFSLQTGRPSGSGSDLSGSVLVGNEPATPSQSALGAPMMPQPSRISTEPTSGPAPSVSSKVRLRKSVHFFTIGITSQYVLMLI